MFTKKFLFALCLVSILLVSLAISSFSLLALSSHGETASDFSRQHPGWTLSLQDQTVYRLDCFRRELHLTKPSTLKTDASNYFMNLS